MASAQLDTTSEMAPSSLLIIFFLLPTSRSSALVTHATVSSTVAFQELLLCLILAAFCFLFFFEKVRIRAPSRRATSPPEDTFRRSPSPPPPPPRLILYSDLLGHPSILYAIPTPPCSVTVAMAPPGPRPLCTLNHGVVAVAVVVSFSPPWCRLASHLFIIPKLCTHNNGDRLAKRIRLKTYH